MQTEQVLLQMSKFQRLAGDWCCDNCGNTGYCSTRSGNCYGEKFKSYYSSCGQEGGLVPPSPPPGSEGGLVPPPPPPSSTCCESCGGQPFCSPYSGNCYPSKAKSYYESCMRFEPGELIWSDEFDGNGSVDLTKWSYLNGPNHNNQELQYYTDSPANSVLENDKLKITGKCEQHKGMYYTS